MNDGSVFCLCPNLDAKTMRWRRQRKYIRRPESTMTPPLDEYNNTAAQLRAMKGWGMICCVPFVRNLTYIPIHFKAHDDKWILVAWTMDDGELVLGQHFIKCDAIHARAQEAWSKNPWELNGNGSIKITIPWSGAWGQSFPNGCAGK